MKHPFDNRYQNGSQMNRSYNSPHGERRSRFDQDSRSDRYDNSPQYGRVNTHDRNSRSDRHDQSFDRDNRYRDRSNLPVPVRSCDARSEQAAT